MADCHDNGVRPRTPSFHARIPHNFIEVFAVDLAIGASLFVLGAVAFVILVAMGVRL